MDIADKAQYQQEQLAALAKKNAAAPVAGCKYCEACGEEIEPARRKALPSARLCIDCAEFAERQKRGMKKCKP